MFLSELNIIYQCFLQEVVVCYRRCSVFFWCLSMLRRLSKPLSRVIIKSYLNPSPRLDFSSILSINEHKNIINWYWIFYVRPNLWRHQLLLLKLRYDWVYTVYDKIGIKNLKERNIWKWRISLHQFTYKRIHRLRRQTDARESADIIYVIGLLQLRR